MSTLSPHSSGCSPWHRRSNSVQPVSLGSITELPEHAGPSAIGLHQSGFRADCPGVSHWKTGNLNEDMRGNRGLYLRTSVDAGLFGRSKDFRSFFEQWKQLTIMPPAVKKWSMDRECGICFELAVNPRRTRCCGSLFCSEHLIDWLGGHSSIGSCPSCQKICSINSNTISLASPLKPTIKRPCYQSILASDEPSLSMSRHTRSSSIPAFPYKPKSSISSSGIYSPRTCSHYMSASKSALRTPILPQQRTGSPHRAPSRPNTPCSAPFHTDTTNLSGQLPLHSNPPVDCVPSFSTAGSFVVVSEDTGGLLLLAALTLYIYIYTFS